ncbi:MAG: hypothetical protein J1F09_07660 [Oscillospiraceae bacterium]|nr:hypothetical protein [Oscillospiraceae bacterium]
MTVVRLFDVRPDMRTSEYALLGGIAFRAALSEKSDVPFKVRRRATDRYRTSI